ncbi:MAG TPA: tetratricopeptide repeat protein, partial [Candidatus Eisenbacteria bacterium]
MTRFLPRGQVSLLAALLGLFLAGPSAAMTPDEIRAGIEQGRLLDAFDAATLLVAAEPTNCQAWLLLGDANRKLARVGAAAQAYRTGLEACPEDKDLLKTYGLMLDESEQYDEAARVLSRYWALDSSDAALGARIGAACYRAGRCPDGRKVYDAILAANPGSSGDRLAYAQLLSRTCKDFEAAKVQFEKLVADSPNDPNVACAWVYALADAGQTDEAAKVATSALAASGGTAGCLYAAWGRALEGAADS